MVRRFELEELLAPAAGADLRPEVPRWLADLRTLPGFDCAATFGPVYSGRSDPCTHRTPHALWRASRTPEGPGTLHVYVQDHGLWARAFGPGGRWLMTQAPRIASLADRPEAFQPGCPKLRRLRPQVHGHRLGQTPTVMDALLPVIVHQRVKTYEARRSWARMARALGEPAPGAESFLLLPPDPRRMMRAPSWWFAEHGVEQKRARALVEVCRHAARLNAAPVAEVVRLSAHLPGFGPWTLGNVRLKAFGDPDAVVVGDYHLPHAVTYFFTGAPRGSDQRMLELLEPFAGQRGRALMWIKMSGGHEPRFGPKQRFRFRL